MLGDELATYLAAAGLGLTVGTNLFSVPFPASAPDASVCVVEWGALASEETFGASLSAVAMEKPLFKVMVRGARDAADTARQLAGQVCKKLRRLGPATLSGVAYYNVTAEPPQFMSFDDNGRPRWHFDGTAFKAES